MIMNTSAVSKLRQAFVKRYPKGCGMPFGGDGEFTDKGAKIEKRFFRFARQNTTLNQRVFRITSLSRFLAIIKTRQLGFCHPRVWDDPYEMAFFRDTKKDYHPLDLKTLMNGIYAQCWSLNRECDGLWRNYTRVPKDAISIQMESTVGDILEAMYQAVGFDGVTLPMDCCFAGKVVYGSVECLRKRLAHDFPNVICADVDKVDFNSIIQKQIHPVLLKRKAFRYEQEVRFYYDLGGRPADEVFDGGSNINGDWINIPFNPARYIKRICLDPWTGHNVDEAVRKVLAEYGCQSIKVTASNLYEDPNS